MSDAEKKEEKKILLALNKQIWIERIKYQYNRWREHRLYGNEEPDQVY